MKTILVLIVSLISVNVNAMRCGNTLILEGDPIGKLVQSCGEPSGQAMNTLYYNRDKMIYTIHYNIKNIITQIDENLEM